MLLANVNSQCPLLDLLIVQDELKAIQEFQVKELKLKDLTAVCSCLKIKGVKNALKEVFLQKIVSIYKVKERYGKISDNVEVILSATRKKPHCPFRLLNILFSDRFMQAWLNLGMWLTGQNLSRQSIQQSTILGRNSRKQKSNLTEKGKKSAEIWITSLRHNGKQKKMLAKKKKILEKTTARPTVEKIEK
jgi:hypothetical protein